MPRPSRRAGSVSVASNGSAAVTAASDPENDPLNYAITSGPAHGTLSGSGPNLIYTPAPNNYGPDSSAFRANDGATTATRRP